MKVTDQQDATAAEASDGAAPRRTRGVSKNPDEARRKILESAIRLFGRQGFKTTSTEHIAEAAGYSQATVFFHFQTKGGLLKACLDEALERAKVLVPTDVHIGTVALMEKLDNVFDDNPTAEFFARMMLEQSSNDVVQPIYADFHAHIRDMIRDEIVQELDVAVGVASHAAATILSMMIGVHAEYRVEHVRFDRSDYRAMLLKVTKLTLAALRQP
jgi:AcrR family transcriptional regulator